MNINLYRALQLLMSVAVVLLGALGVQAQDMTFVQIPGVSGESTDAAHVDWIDAYALDHASSYPSGPGPVFSEVAFLKGTDKSSPVLHMALANSTNLGTVTIEVCRIGSPQECYYRLELSNTRLTSVDVAGSACIDPLESCTPSQTESIALVFQTIKWTYTEWDGGTPAGTVERCWDVVASNPC